MNTNQRNSGQCSCGAIKFDLVGAPIARAYCHCTICQKFNHSSYADVTAYYAKDVVGVDESKIEFKVHKQPPLVRRGKCMQCKKPAIEKLSIPLMPKMILVPGANIDDASLLPDPLMHIFYDKRVNDFDDDLKKHSGFLSSQIGLSIGLIKGMISGKQ